MKIMEWPQDERPRERLLRQGPQSLSDAELLAIFLRTGTQGLNAVDLARHLLGEFGSLRALLEADLKKFTSHLGLGSAKYCQLQACLELSKRYLQENLQHSQSFSNPNDVKLYLKSLLSHHKREQFVALFLNNQHQLLASETLFLGTINSSEVHPRVVVEKALTYHAAAVILAHNHPSGSLEPSPSDRHITDKIQEALGLLDIRTLDHIIVAQGGSYSFAEHGLL